MPTFKQQIITEFSKYLISDLSELIWKYLEPPELEPTNNSLGDAIKWIKDGNLLFFCYNKQTYYIWHNCENKDPNWFRCIYLNFERVPSLLEEGEWESVIKDAGCKACSCSVEERTRYLKNCQYRHSLTI